MSLRRTLAISRRIASQFRRDHRTLALLFVAPILILALLGWVIRGQDAPSTRLAIVNQAGAVGDTIARTIESAAGAKGIVIEQVADEADARRRLTEDRLDVVLVLPDTLAAALQSGGGPKLRVLTQGANPADDGTRFGQIQQVLLDALPTPAPVPRVEREAIYGSTNADFLDQFAPALIGFIGYFLVFILTGVSFLRERVGGTLERLVATPVRRSEIVAGYSIGFGFFATLQVAVILAFALGSVEVPALGPTPAFSIGDIQVPTLGPTSPFLAGLGIANAGSPALVFAVTLLLGLGAVNLGIFISTFARTELQIIQFIPLVVVPQGLLSGIFWPVEALPDVLEAVARLLPVTYAVDGLREVLIKGADLATPALQTDLAVLASIAVVLVLLAAATIRREVA